MKRKACTQCGSRYELYDYHVPMRDKDSLHCEVCGSELMRWNGSKAWNAKLIERGTKSDNPPPQA